MRPGSLRVLVLMRRSPAVKLRDAAEAGPAGRRRKLRRRRAARRFEHAVGHRLQEHFSRGGNDQQLHAGLDLPSLQQVGRIAQVLHGAGGAGADIGVLDRHARDFSDAAACGSATAAPTPAAPASSRSTTSSRSNSASGSLGDQRAASARADRLAGNRRRRRRQAPPPDFAPMSMQSPHIVMRSQTDSRASAAP